MAFDRDFLALIGPSGTKAPRSWSYATEDALTVVDAAAYFNDASDVLLPADLIHVSVIADLTADPWVVSDAGHVVVLTNASGVVDTSDESALTLLDSR